MLCVIFRHVFRSVERPIPRANYSSCGIAISAVEHSPQANLLPKIGFLFVFAAVVDGAQESVVCHNNTVYSKGARPSVDRKLNIICFALLHAKHLRIKRLAGGIQQHLSFQCVIPPAFLKLVPVPTIYVLVAIALPLYVRFGPGKMHSKQKAQPFVRIFVLNGKGSEQCSHK